MDAAVSPKSFSSGGSEKSHGKHGKEGHLKACSEDHIRILQRGKNSHCGQGGNHVVTSLQDIGKKKNNDQ